jgi:hypothetical protein
MLGILNKTSKQTFVQKFSEIKVYNALTPPIVLYGTEIWTFRKKDMKRLTSMEIRFLEEHPGTLFLITKGIKKFWKS